ncbi:unnamed protein product [Caenorhabditis nigoni]
MKNLETYKSRCDDAINAFSNAMKTLEPYCNRYSREFFSSPLGIANSLLGKFVDIGKGVDEKVCFLMETLRPREYITCIFSQHIATCMGYLF